MRLSDEKINEIRNGADIVDVIGHYLTLLEVEKITKQYVRFMMIQTHH